MCNRFFETDFIYVKHKKYEPKYVSICLDVYWYTPNIPKMTTIVCKKLAKMGTHMNPRKSKICLSNVEINCNANKTYKIFRPLHEGMSSFVLTAFNFTYFFVYFISNFRLHTLDVGADQFDPVLGLDRVRSSGSKIVLGRIRPSGSKIVLGQRLI